MTNFSDFSNHLADAVEQAAQSVVTVLAHHPVSGTVVGEDVVLTVAHTLHADETRVLTPDGRELGAVVAGRDPSSDLALLKVEGLKMPALSASAGARVGELLLAVGRPMRGPQAALGLMNSEPQVGLGRGWLQTGAAPFRGVSGGALLDARGGLVGVLNAGIARGTLLAVPAERALKVAAQLGEAGRVPRGYLGILTQPVRFPAPEAADQQPETGGQEPHDPRQSDPRGRWGQHPFAERGFGGRGPEGRDGRARGAWGRGAWARGEWSRGERGRERPERGGHPEDWGRPEGRGPWGRGPWHGEDPRTGPHRGEGRGGRLGLTVIRIDEGSPAAAAGLKVGDILLALNDLPLRHPNELLSQIRDYAGETVQIRLLRAGEEQGVAVKVGER